MHSAWTLPSTIRGQGTLVSALSAMPSSSGAGIGTRPGALASSGVVGVHPALHRASSRHWCLDNKGERERLSAAILMAISSN